MPENIEEYLETYSIVFVYKSFGTAMVIESVYVMLLSLEISSGALKFIFPVFRTNHPNNLNYVVILSLFAVFPLS